MIAWGRTAGHRQGRMAGQVQREGVRIPGAADGADRLAGNGDDAVRILIDRQRRRGECG